MKLSRQQQWLVLAGLLTVVGGAVVWAILANIKPAAGTAICRETAMTHQVTIQNDKVEPYTTEAMLCDKLVFTNKDKVERVVAFGVHDQHVSYDGVTERLLGQSQSFTITLNRSGRYHFHDHHQEEVGGYFVVESTSRLE